MNYLFTSESVSEGHPDKVADQISDSILDEFLARDPQSKVACETLVTTGQVVVAGEIRSEAYVDLQDVIRRVINKIGYNRPELGFDGNSCGILSALHEQSADINRGVDRGEEELQGAGDQGMMFGYATDETPMYIPLSLAVSHAVVKELAAIRREGVDMTYLRPDAKSQVTVEYGDDNRPLRIHTLVVSTQHDEFIKPTAENGLTQDEADRKMVDMITDDIRRIVLPRVKSKMPSGLAKMLDDENMVLHVNPTGKFVIGGPCGDTGVTGRKIIVDTYGGHGAHGGGAFSGKDPSKVDRSAAYAARHIAKNIVAAGIASRALIQVAYAIGIAKPVSLNVNTFGTAKVNFSDAEISKIVAEMFDMRPAAIEKRFGLRNPIYAETASYGHVGRSPQKVTKTFTSHYEKPIVKEVELFTWEKTDRVDDLKKAFGIG